MEGSIIEEFDKYMVAMDIIGEAVRKGVKHEDIVEVTPRGWALSID